MALGLVVFLLAFQCGFAQQSGSPSQQPGREDSIKPAALGKPNSQDQQPDGKPNSEESQPPAQSADTPLPSGSEQSAQSAQQPATQEATQPTQPLAASANTPSQSGTRQGDEAIPESERQPKRILGIMPNYRAVSAGSIPPPPTAKQSLWIATQNSFDYSAFVFVGLTSLIAKGTDAHPDLGKGPKGYWNYYWRGFLDKTDGNYLVLFAMPTLFREDERYYAMGHAGGVWKRMIYSASRVVITPNYEGHDTFNIAELGGRAAAQAVSVTYYPSHDRTAGAIAAKFGWAIGRDALTQVFREFWPDIAVHVLHRHP